MSIITNVEKEGAVFIITFSGVSKPVKYDCETNTLYGVSGKAIKQLSSKCKYARDRDETNKYYRDLHVFLEKYDSTYNLTCTLDQYYNYQELYDGPLAKKIQKGYIDFLKENNYKINSYTEILYNLHKKILNNYTPTEKEVVKKICSRPELSTFAIQRMIALPASIVKKILKIYSVDKKPDIVYFSYLLNKCWDYKDKCEEWLDINRGVEHNYKNILLIEEEEKNKELINNQKKILFIEKLSTENLCVIVPTSLQALVDEGKQQNNCVGYYYNDSIKKGENVIYFIRRKNNPKKSYITCRFKCTTSSGVRPLFTVEARTKNNNWHVEDNELEVAKLINKIDEMLLEHIHEAKGE